jgi:hypothetical protein
MSSFESPKRTLLFIKIELNFKKNYIFENPINIGDFTLF